MTLYTEPKPLYNLQFVYAISCQFRELTLLKVSHEKKPLF